MALAAITTNCADPTAPDLPDHSMQIQAATTGPVVLLGAGDIAGCSTTGDEQTATLMDGLLSANPGATVFLAGDNVYENATAAEYQNCYDPSWGRFKSRTRPTAGNHEYQTGTANAYFDYFNGAGSDSGVAGKRGRGYYSFEAGQWHIVMLNANHDFVSTTKGSIQETWLKADLAANSKPCVMAVWHQALVWSGDTVVRSYVQDFWRDLYAVGADLIINGHQHFYERFAPMDPNGVADASRGIRQIIVGTGGKSVSTPSPRRANSQVLNGNTFGVIKLTLGDGTYSWQFMPVAGKSFTDSGSGSCHGATNPPPPPPNNPPTAAFTSSCTNLSCSFTDGSTDNDGTIASRSWTFGDGGTSTATSPSHAYAAGGTYSVKLTVTDNDGATNSVTKQVTVSPANVSPTAAFTSSCTNLSCSFTDGSSDSDGSIASRSWSFGDNTSGTGTAPSHTYAAAGTYTVTLTVTDDKGATGTVSHSVTVQAANVSPNAAFSKSCTNLSCGFTDASSDPDGSIASRSWTFGDNTSGTGATPSHTYGSAGTYTVTLTVTDNKGATSTASRQVTVSAANASPTASFTRSCTALGCKFTDGSSDPDGVIAGRSWNFGDGASSTATNPSHTYAAPGSYTVTLTVTDDDGATDATSQSFNVTAPNTPPSAEFTSSCTNLACSFTDGSSDSDGSIASRSWKFGDNATGTGAGPSHTYGSGGTYDVTLTVTDNDGATNAVTHQVTVAPGNVSPKAGFTQSCTDLGCDFTDASTDSDGSIASWSWDFGDNSSSTSASPHHDYAQAGTYTVVLTVTDNDGGTGSKTRSLTVGTAPDQTPNAPPVAAFAPSCTDLSCSFSNGSSDPDGSITARSWDFGDGGTSTAINPNHTYTAPGSYTVSLTVTDDSAATASVSHTVTVSSPNSPPVAGFSSNCSELGCGFTDASSDTDGSIASRSWKFGDGTTGTGSTPRHTFAAGGTYTVTLTVTDDQGATGSASHDVTVAAGNVSPTAGFSKSCTNLACNFTDASSDADGSIARRSWNFGDGASSALANPSHTYASPGSYTVSLTVTDDQGATGTASRTVTVSAGNSSPSASFTKSCTNLACGFTDGSSDPDGFVASRSWTFGDGTNATGTSPSHTYAAGGTYTVTLTVTDDEGATGSASQSVTVAPANTPPTAAFTSSCTNLSCAFTDGSTDSDGTIASRSWTFGDNTTSTATNPSHAYAAAGTYTVTLTVTDNKGASKSISKQVTVSSVANVAPNAYFGSSCTKLVCTFTDRSKDSDGTITAWRWTFGDATTASTVRNPSHTYKAGGTYKVVLKVTDNKGATGSISHSVTVAP